MAYVAQSDLEALITPQTVREIYDDTNVGSVNIITLGEDISIACQLVDAQIARVYPGPFPITQPINAWVALTSYAGGKLVVPSIGNGFAYVAVSAGSGTTGTTQPSWPVVYGQTVTDGTMVWQCTSITPSLIKFAALLYLKALAYARDPERVRKDPDAAMKAAEKFGERLCQAQSFLTDLATSPEPANVGGFIYDRGPRTTIELPGGPSALGDF